MSRISIVTICFNNPEDLELTCRHVDSQVIAPFEHIIVDGSTDGRIKELLDKKLRATYRRSIHEKDDGISDAFNKGILASRGDIIHLHNAGDYYYDDSVLELVTNTFAETPGITWLHGKYAQYRGGTWVISGKPFEKGKLYRGMRTIGHPTMFVKKELYDRYGLFDVNKRIAMDYDFLVRIADEPFAWLDYPLVYFTPGGLSEQNVWAGLKEVRDSYEKYRGPDLRVTLWALRTRLLNLFVETAAGRMLFRWKNR